MAFLLRLTSFESAVLLFCICTIIFGPVYSALHTDPQGNRYYYAIPLLWLLVVIVLVVALVRVLFA